MDAGVALEPGGSSGRTRAAGGELVLCLWGGLLHLAPLRDRQPALAVVSWTEEGETGALPETVACWGFLHSWAIYVFESARKNAILLAKDRMF